MRNLLLVFVAVLLFTACGKPGSSAAENAKGTSSSNADTTIIAQSASPSSVDLKSVLLSSSDLPQGWSVSEQSGSILTFTFCGMSLEQRQLSDASRQFQQAATGSYLLETISLYRPGEARSWMNATQGTLECKQWDQSLNDGTSQKYEIAALTFPQLGDQSMAYKVSGNSGDATFEFDVAFIRRGDYVLEVGHIGQSPLDMSLLANVSKTALQKLNHKG